MENKDVSIKRLEILRNAMILNHLESIDFNSDEERALAYESLLDKTVKEGEFDDIFLSDSLDKVDDEERKRILDLSKKYHYLCFYGGNSSYWLDSVEGVSNGVDSTAAIILRNYDYLIRLAKNGGEDVLKFLTKFQSSEQFDNSSVIALLINKFWGDLDSLEKVLLEMSKEDGQYKDFTDTQKIILCDYPDGLLIRKNEDSIEFIPSSEIKKVLSNEYIGEDNYSIKDIDSKEFEKMVQRINEDCLKGTVYKK